MAPPPATPSPRRFLKLPHTSANKVKDETPASKLKLKHKALKAPPDSFEQRQAPRFSDVAPTAATPVSKPRIPRFDDAHTTPAPKVNPTHADQFKTTPKFGYARPPSPKRPRLAPPEAEEERFATPRRFGFAQDNTNALVEESTPPEDDMLFLQSRHDDNHHHHHDQSPISKPVFRTSPRKPVDADELAEHMEMEPPSPLPQRPKFITSSSAHATKMAAHPLPEAFSPHKRGQKFVPGGMADEVRQWIMDTSQIASHNRGNGSLRLNIKVEECRQSGGMTLVRGVAEDGRESRMCLPGAGAGADVRKGIVEVGAVVVVKGVMWELDLGGEGVWTVGTEWSVVRENG